jgi:hypothetical protein
VVPTPVPPSVSRIVGVEVVIDEINPRKETTCELLEWPNPRINNRYDDIRRTGGRRPSSNCVDAEGG